MQEQWRDIVGYEGAYQVSDLGRVRSLDREVTTMSRWGSPVVRKLKGRTIAAHWTNNAGYYTVFLGQGNQHGVHRLVAAAFVEGGFDGAEVNHKNGVKTDNRPCNLEWLSSSENKKHSYRELVRKRHSKTTKVRLQAPCGKVFDFENMVVAAKHLGVNPSSVHSAAHRKHTCKNHTVEVIQ